MEDDKELKDAVERAAFSWLKEQLDCAETIDENGRKVQDWSMRRAAAQEICRRAGILDAVKALSMDGELSPPPPWPQVDVVPVGGGPGFLDMEVRTYHSIGGKMTVPMRMSVPDNTFRGKERSEKIQNGIGEAKERGTWTLKRWIEKYQ